MANREFLQVTGHAGKDIVGRRLKEVIDCPLDPAVLQKWLGGRIPPGSAEPVRFTNTLTDPAGRQRIISVTAKPIVDEAGFVRQIVFLGVDDTERREAEQALFDAERLTTVGEMAATVAHEINQPLQVIIAACESVCEEFSEATDNGRMPDGPFVTSKLDRIFEQVERAGRITGELRAFVRGTTGEKAGCFDPGIAVRGAIDLTQHGMRSAGIALSSSLSERLPAVLGHVGRLEQVLINLINNARDADGRTIDVSAAALRRDGQALVRIAVEDGGPGIPPEILSNLFVAFVTTKPRGKGTGLGLRICRRIVEEMGGSISATNRPEGGARFEILLPAALAGE
jgi:PAS domain S-box-containing protein